MRIFLILSFFFLSGCGHDLFGTQKPTIIEKPVTIERTVYPSLPRVPYPPSISLIPFEWSWPRIADELDIINSKKCKSVDKSKRDINFWKKCGIHKVLDINIYIGMNKENYKIFIQDWNRILGREKQWRAIVDEVNRQRKEFKNIKEKDDM